MTPTADVVVVGGGHNGLVAAAYLARAGLDVVVVEGREALGGASTTEELIPGYRSSSCAFVIGLMRPEIIRDLELKRHGLTLYQAPDALGCTIHEDGRHFFTYGDLDRELTELRDHFGRRDAQGFVAFGAAMRRVGALLNPMLLAPPLGLDAVRERFVRAGAGDLFEPFIIGSVRDLLDQYFDDDTLKGYLAFPSIVSVFGGPSDPGTAYVLTHHAVSEFEGRFGQWGFVRGGMGGLTEALASAAAASGARVRAGTPVRELIVGGDGSVRGVVLDGGEEIRGRAVLSTVDPVRTLLGLLGREHLAEETLAEIERYDVRGSMARVHLAVEALPAYVGLPARVGPGPEHLGHTLLGPTLERFGAAARAQAAGELPEDFAIEVLIDSARDRGLVPEGRQMIVTGIQQLPRELRGRTWDDAKDEFTGRVIAQLDRFAPGLADRVLATHTITPLDLERDYGMTGGNIYHGAMGVDQLFDRRPFPRWAGYRTPVPGLYLGGSGTHPGGGVMGASGHNAAATVLDDLLALTPPWKDSPPESPTSTDRLTDVVAQSAVLQRIVASAGRSRLLRPLARRATTRREDP